MSVTGQSANLGIIANPFDCTYETMLAGVEINRRREPRGQRLRDTDYSTSESESLNDTVRTVKRFDSPPMRRSEMGNPVLHSTAVPTPPTQHATSAAYKIITGQATQKGTTVGQSTRRKLVSFNHICDLVLPEGEKLHELDAFPSSIRNYHHQDMMKVQLPEYLRVKYSSPYLFINNVTGVIMTGEANTVDFFSLRPTDKWCSFEPIPGLPMENMADYHTVRRYGPNEECYPRWSYFREGWSENTLVVFIRLDQLKQVPTKFAQRGYLYRFQLPYPPREEVYLDPWTGNLHD